MVLASPVSLFLTLNHADVETVVFDFLGWPVHEIFSGQTQSLLELDFHGKRGQ